MSDWEDIAYGPSVSADTGGDWEDVSYGDPISTQKGIGEQIFNFIAGDDVKPPSSIGEAFSNLGSNLTSSDWWLTRPSGERLSAGQAVAGPFLAANNAINPFGDETVAGGNSIIDFLTGNPTTYDQRLAQARGIERSFDEAAPVLSGTLDVAGALKLPTKIGTAPTAMGRIGQAAKESGLYGLLFGAGGGSEDVNLTDRVQSGLTGGGLSYLLGGGLGTTAEGIRKVLGEGDFVPGISKTLTQTPEQEAAQILREAAESDIVNLTPDLDNPLFKYRTLAEATQNPNLAQLEQSLGKSSPKMNDLLNANLQNRQQQQKLVLSNLSEQPIKSAEAGGETLRELIEPKAVAAKETIKNIFDSIDPNGQVPMVSLRSSFNKLASNSYKAGGMPSQIAGLLEEVNKKVQIGDISGKPKIQTYDYMKALRERAQDAWVQLKNFDDAKGAAVANDLVKEIDRSIDKAGNMGLMKPADIERFKAGKKAAEQYFDTYGAKGAGNIISKMKEGQYLSKASNVVQNTFDGSAEGTRKILRAIGDSPEELDKARGSVRDLLFRMAEDNDGIISPGKFRTNLRKYREGIKATVGNKALFEADHLDTLDALSYELSLLDPQSSKSVKQMAYTASRGQPTTAQALMSKDVAKRFLGGTVGKLDEWFTTSRKEKVDAILADALISPQNARTLIDTSPKSISNYLEKLQKKSSLLAKPAPMIGRATGSLSTPQKRSDSQEEVTMSTSFNTKLDQALTQAEKEIAMKAPEIISVKRTSSKPLAETFIEKEEGGQQLKAYPPPAKGSGVTVARGVDLGQHSEKDLENMGVSPKVITKVRKYLGAKDATARKLLKEKPLTLTKAEADELDEAVKNDIFGTVESKLKDKGVTLSKLPEEAQAVVKSLAWNFGKGLDQSIPTIWKAIVNKDWAKVQDLLVTTKWKQPELLARRKREAELLSRIA